MMGLFESSALAWSIYFTLIWAVLCLCATWFPWPKTMHHRQRMLWARLWLYAPLIGSFLLLFSSFATGFIGFGSSDHCLSHANHHLHHLCLVHPPHASGQWLAWLLPCLLLLSGFILVFGFFRRTARLAGPIADLAAVSRPSKYGKDVRLIDSDRTLAFTTGLRRPVILLSTGLLQKISPQTLAVILAHERAHLRRKDLLFSRFDGIVAALYPSAVALPILKQLSLAREQACDAVAAAKVGDGITVAQALTQVTRLKMKLIEGTISFNASVVEARVLHLLNPPAARRLRGFIPLLVLFGLCVAGFGPVHEWMEHFITHLLH